MDYSKQIGMIAEFLKPYCKGLSKDEKIVVFIDTNIELSVSGGSACDIRITDKYRGKNWNEYTKWSSKGISEWGKYKYEDGKHSEYFKAFREVPEYIARPLILQWKEIKDNFIRKYEQRIAENEFIKQFEI
jgi:hypothetical protein